MNNNLSTTALLHYAKLDANLKTIGLKVLAGERITPDEGLYLFEKGEWAYLGYLANFIRNKLHQDNTYFNRNFHIEPTNVCVFSCKFCSYSRLYAHKEDGWELTAEQIIDRVKSYDNQQITEVHIVGGVHPKMNMAFFLDILRKIKAHRPALHIKGFTAVELDYMIRKAKLTIEEGLKQFKEAGLDSLPGGGAEIFAPETRRKICQDKVSAEGWLHIHKTAHQLGMKSNATMLYGHLESYEDRVDHLNRLRQLQDETKGFNTFIPLKFRNKNNDMSDIAECSVIEDMRVFAISRIYLDNISHIKAYWPMLGRTKAQMSLDFGVDDLDGTIDDSTKIYSMAGSEEQNPVLTTEALATIIKQAGRKPVERDTLYNVVKVYD
ncbi:MAG: aminofutalosine synthase MqnE [Phycisphaerales bacterium]|nr:aminofutalosine synthase MqnE [Phycisphaerales bacterium]